MLDHGNFDLIRWRMASIPNVDRPCRMLPKLVEDGFEKLWFNPGLPIPQPTIVIIVTFVIFRELRFKTESERKPFVLLKHTVLRFKQAFIVRPVFRDHTSGVSGGGLTRGRLFTSVPRPLTKSILYLDLSSPIHWLESLTSDHDSKGKLYGRFRRMIETMGQIWPAGTAVTNAGASGESVVTRAANCVYFTGQSTVLDCWECSLTGAC